MMRENVLCVPKRFEPINMGLPRIMLCFAVGRCAPRAASKNISRAFFATLTWPLCVLTKALVFAGLFSMWPLLATCGKQPVHAPFAMFRHRMLRTLSPLADNMHRAAFGQAAALLLQGQHS